VAKKVIGSTRFRTKPEWAESIKNIWANEMNTFVNYLEMKIVVYVLKERATPMFKISQ